MYSKRISYIGSFEAHECKIQLKNVSMSDQGSWTCEVHKTEEDVVIENIQLTVLPKLAIFKG